MGNISRLCVALVFVCPYHLFEVEKGRCHMSTGWLCLWMQLC